ncbi:ABC transporter permease [Cohnella hongkongensis]|uniref:ABC transporter permease n=1 Tax=Cohnella hongkongensis TaxID=178337 RepID=A0ABV9FBE9_9BACL
MTSPATVRYTPSKLFLERAGAFWRAIWKCWRTVLDWTVCLYIVLPWSFISAGIYRDLTNNPPAGLEHVPLYPLLLVLALLQLAGKFRTFAEPGDGLLLHRIPKWRKAFVVWGFVYGGAARIIALGCIVAALSPILLPVFGLSAASLASLVLSYTSAGLFWTLLRDRIALRWSGWRRWAAVMPAGAAFVFGTAALADEALQSPAAGLLIGAVFLTAAGVLLLLRQRMRGTLLHEIAVENGSYAALVGWLLQHSLEKRPVPTRSKPILFARSQPLLRQRGGAPDRLADSWMKAVLRRPDLMSQLAYFFGAGSAALALPPVAIAAFVWLALPFLVVATLRRSWKQWMAEAYVSLFEWRKKTEEEASRKAIAWLALPMILLWSLLLGVRIGLAFGGPAWMAAAAVPAAGWIWLRSVNGFLAASSASRREKE